MSEYKYTECVPLIDINIVYLLLANKRQVKNTDCVLLLFFGLAGGGFFTLDLGIFGSGFVCIIGMIN